MIEVTEAKSVAELPKTYLLFYDDVQRAVDWIENSTLILENSKLFLKRPLRAYRYNHTLAFELEETDEVDRIKRDSVRDGAEGQTGPEPSQPS